MHVLVAGPSPSTEDIGPALEGLGHTVSACHDDVGDECVALRGGLCPLEALPIDVVVADPASETSRCARRRAVPVVDASGDKTTFAPRLSAAVTALPRHTAVAERAALEVLLTAGLPPRPLEIAADRRNGGLLVTIAGPAGMDARLRQRMSVRVHARLRSLDRWASSIDIVVTETGSPPTHAEGVRPAAMPNPLAFSSAHWPSRSAWTLG